MHYVALKLGKEAFIILKTSQYGDVEEIMAAAVENKQDFLYELFGGGDMVEDRGELEQIEITGVYN